MLIELYLLFLKLGLFSFGGGYAMIPLLRQELISSKGWMTEMELVDMLAISEMTPGPIAVNLATYLGYNQAGFFGSFFATLGVLTPSFIVMTIFWLILKKLSDNPYLGYFMKGLRPVVIGLVFSGLLAIAPGSITSLVSLVIAVVAFYLIHVKSMNPILTIVLGAIVGMVIY